MKVLITGIAGLLGSRLADWIIDNTDHTVVGVDDLSGGYIENVNQEAKMYQVDLVDLQATREVFSKEEPDLVYHFAAYAAEGLSPFIRKFNYQNNLIASTNLITLSIEHSVSRFVFASSMSVYGDKHAPPFTEEMLPCPIDPYGIAKYAVEQDLHVAYEQHGLEYTIIRPHNFYGINQNIWDKYRNVLGIWMYQIMNGQRPTVFGDGLQTRAFSYVDDSVIPMWLAGIESGCAGETINLGGIKEYSIIEACQELIKITGVDLDPLHLEARHEAKHAWSTWDKSVELLNFKHTVDLDEGLTKMWEWAQKQPNRKRFVWPSYELEKGLYSYWKED